MSSTQSLLGKTAIVTGASRGIGASIALELASRGADVLIHYSSSSTAADSIVSQIRATGRRAEKVQADLESKGCGREIVEKAVEFAEGGGIDVMVLNGAVSYNLPLEEITEENVDEHYTKQMDINVCSTILIVQALLKYLARPSRIVLLSSVSARGGFVSQTVYDQSSAPLHRAIADERTVGATKASLEHFARVWSKELGQKYGTTVNCVNPGPVATDMWFSATEEFRESLALENTPADGRVGQPDDIAQVVAFLCEEGSRWVTGSVVCANGGLLPN